MPGALTQLTVDPAFDGQPAISPDGTVVVFVSERSGVPELWRRPIVEGEESALTSGDGGAVDPDFSPDGRWISYSSLGRGGIWKVPAKDGNAARLTDFGSRPAFSPDGARLVFQSQEQVILGGGQWAASRDSTLWILEVATGALTSLTRIGSTPGGHGAPRWSPDGSTIVSAGPVATMFPAESARLLVPHFLWPDGRRVAVRRYRPGAGRLDALIASLEGGVERDLRDVGRVPGVWQTLLSGELLVGSGEGRGRAVAVDPASGRFRPVPELGVTRTRAGADILNNCFAPYLSTITATIRRGGRFAIVQSRIGQPWAPRTVVEGEYVGFPVASAGGAPIAFERLVGHRDELWAIEADGSRLRRLAGGAVTFAGGWSPDASRHAFVALRDGAWNVFTMREDGTHEKALTANRRFSSYYRHPNWSPAGDAVVVERTTSRGEVWSLRLDARR